MATKPTKPSLPLASDSQPKQVRELIETLDKLAYEKPAGFIGYLATCMSSMSGGGGFAKAPNPTEKE